MRKIIACIIAVFSAFAVSGQNPSDSVKVYFSLNQGHFDPSLRDNAASIDSFIGKIQAAVSSDNLDRIEIYGYASPDGPLSTNERLAKTRSKAIAAYIIERTGIGQDVVKTYPEGVAWNELRRMVADREDVPSRNQVLKILDDTSFPANPRGGVDRSRRLKSLAGGAPYRWMLVHLFPQLRHAFAVSIYLKSDRQAVEDAAETASQANAADTLNTAGGNGSDAAVTPEIPERAIAGKSSDEEPAGSSAAQESDITSETSERTIAGKPSDKEPAGTSVVQESDITPKITEENAAGTSAEHVAAEESSAAESAASSVSSQDTADDAGTPRHRMALKTDLPYYAILMPNLELEYLITDRWSVSLEGDIAWWGKYPNNKSYRIAIITPEVRHWIKPREPWHGLYVGAFAGGGWYDFLNGGLGYYGDGVMAGLSVGYMWPIGKHLSLEAGIGAGYMHTRFKEYVPFEGHHLYQRTKSLDYFGPLKVKFSLVWRLWDENKSKRRHEK